MGRNSELIRQWTLLQQIANARDRTIPKMAEALGVSTRTVRRDLAALQEAGFPIYDDTTGGSKCWRVETKSLGALARSGLTFSELCALYFSRALIECFAGTHLLADVQSALRKFESALTPQMKKFVDRLPGIVTAKPAGTKKQGAGAQQVIATLLEAILHEHVVTMRYHSWSSAKEKDYVIHPYRLAHVQGGLYLVAFVPAYHEVRTFAVERVRRATRSQKSFTPLAEFESDPFKHSLGAYRGRQLEGTAPLSPAHCRVYQGALLALVSAPEGPAGRLGDDDDGGVGRLCAEKLDPQFRPPGEGVVTRESCRLGARRTGRRARAVPVGRVQAYRR